MPQAKRRAARSGASHRQSFHGLGLLLAGMVIGSLATILWQGMQAGDGGVGAGIRGLFEQFRQADKSKGNTPEHNRGHNRTASTQAKPQATFDFYTVLPEIEVVVPSVESDLSFSLSPANVPRKTTANVAAKVSDANVARVSDVSAYMLQAGSYKNPADADRLKAELAFQGLVSTIQKISIQDRGDFYRVRLGPYASYEQMAAADQKLARQGIKTLRLKISTGG